MKQRINKIKTAFREKNMFGEVINSRTSINLSTSIKIKKNINVLILGKTT